MWTVDICAVSAATHNAGYSALWLDAQGPAALLLAGGRHLCHPMWHCHLAPVSQCHTVTLSHCHTIILSYCHTDRLSHRAPTHASLVTTLPLHSHCNWSYGLYLRWYLIICIFVFTYLFHYIVEYLVQIFGVRPLPQCPLLQCYSHPSLHQSHHSESWVTVNWLRLGIVPELRR